MLTCFYWLLKKKKKDLKNLDSCKLSFSEGIKIFVNESLWSYCRYIWNRFKNLRGKQKTARVLNY